MLRVTVFVQSATIMKHGEKLYYFLIGAGCFGKMDSIFPDSGQMAEAVNALPVDLELIFYGTHKIL